MRYTEGLSQSIQKEAQPLMRGQVALIKTANAPDLLTRSLRAIRENLATTQSVSTIMIGVMDDSTDPASRERNRQVLAASGVTVSYLSTKEVEPTDLLTRIKERAYKKAYAQYGISQSDFSNAFQFLLTEQLDLDKPTIHSDETVGYGPVSTVNSSALLGSYMLGQNGIAPEEGIFTQYDDDVIHGQTLTKADGHVKLAPFDAFAERDTAFADPETVMSVGKYVGIEGNPLTAGINMLEATHTILQDYDLGEHDRPSKYVLYNPEEDGFKELTVEQAFGYLPVILDSFIQRAPLTGFFTKEDFEQLNGGRLRFDGGNYSIRAGERRVLPTPPTGMEEHLVFTAVQELHPGVAPETLMQQETPAAHLRIPTAGERIYASGILTGTHSPRVRHQILIKKLFAEDYGGIRQDAEEAFGTPIDVDRPGFMPQLKFVNRLPHIEKMLGLRDALIQRMGTLQTEHPEIAGRMAIMLQDFDDIEVNKIEPALEPPEKGSRELTQAYVGTKRYLEFTSKYWSDMFDAAYELGQEDAQAA